MREIVFDTETTGINPQFDKVLEIGCVELDGKLPTGRTFHVYINPGDEVEITQEVIRVHGITKEKVADEAMFDGIVDDFLSFIGDAPLVAHNASFDINFINAELAALGLPKLTNDVVDTLALARQKFPGARASLDALCQRFDVDSSARTFHGALLDAQLLSDVYLELCGGLQSSFLSDDSEKSDDDDAVVDVLDMRQDTVRPARTLAQPSADELDAHRAFVDALPNALWTQE